MYAAESSENRMRAPIKLILNSISTYEMRTDFPVRSLSSLREKKTEMIFKAFCMVKGAQSRRQMVFLL